MAVVRIIEQPRAVVIVRGDAGEVVKVEAAGPPAVVKVMSEGIQGRQGEPGADGAPGASASDDGFF